MKSIITILLSLFICLPLMATEKAKEEFEKTKTLAEKGNARAQNKLGMVYHKGTGVPKDDKEAIKWYRKAAEQGDSSAQFCLGVVFLNNAELKDNVTSYAWTDIAAANGYANAKKNKPIIAKGMTHEQIAKAKELVKELVIKNPKLIIKP